MIMFSRHKFRTFTAEFTGHSKMDAEGGAIEPEKHLFAMSFRGEQTRARQGGAQNLRVVSAKNPGLGMAFHPGDPVPQSGVPAFAEIFDFSELRHGREGRLMAEG